ncbi:MAG: AMP-binding protein [Casimicrobiaceae bacterium]
MATQIDRFVHDRLPAPEDLPRFIYELPELQFPSRLNVTAALLDARIDEGQGERIALRDDREQVSYAELARRVDRMGRYLRDELGLIPGNRILLRAGNSIALAVAWLAAAKVGLVVVATMPLLRARELATIIEKGAIDTALCAAALMSDLEAAQKWAPRLTRVIDLAEAIEASKLQGDGHLEALTEQDDIAVMAFTSGTTGQPKAVLHAHRDVLSACVCWPGHVLRARPEDIVIGTPPLAFTFGLGGLLLFPLRAGASVYYADGPFTPEGLVETVRRVGATILYSAPTFYRRMAPFAKDKPMSTLRICVSAGEALPEATRSLWREATGIELLDGIGATEMFHIFISSPPEAVRHGAIGKVVPGYRARIVDDAGNPLPPGTIGKLAVIGPTGCRYLDEPRQRNYVRHGWNHPGDTFRMDADGYFYYHARDDDMIITAGYNVGAPEVENCLAMHPAVAEVGVVGKPDPERGMIIKAYLVLREGFAGDAALVNTLQDFVKAELAPYKYPREIEFVPQLPRTETGKLQRHRLRAMANGEITP